MRGAPLIDTHAHLQLPEYDSDRGAVFQRAADAGVAAVVNIGIDLESSRAALRLAEESPLCWASVGLHPHEASQWTGALRRELRALAEHPKAVAVGETGLDYYRNRASSADQMRAFEGQMELSAETGLPLVIHQRSAAAEVMDALERSGAGGSTLLHCFTGTVEEAARAAALGCYFGLGGVLTYKKADALRLAAASLPEGRFMVETDSPWLAPQSRRGKRNEPSYVRETAEALASVRAVTYERAARDTSETARRFFGIALGPEPNEPP